jgi:hypothetical protein
VAVIQAPGVAMGEMVERVSDALKAKFRTLNVQWFVDDSKNDGPCDMAPWNLLTTAMIAEMREPTKAMLEAGQDEVLSGMESAGDIYKAMIDVAMKD